jgi:hypothetical protein
MIREKGIPTALIFTHGETLGKAMHPENAETVKHLLAPIREVTVGDEAAKRTGSGAVMDFIRNKIHPIVVGRPLADIVVEMVAPGVYVVHRDVLDSMKKLAAGQEPIVEVYPRGIDIRKYRPKEAEQFIEPTEMFDPFERGTINTKPSNSGGNSSVLRSQQLVDEALKLQEEIPARTIGQERQRVPSRVPKGKIVNMTDDKLRRLHDRIASAPESTRTNGQRSSLARLAREMGRRKTIKFN